jgi:hypothetical protein
VRDLTSWAKKSDLTSWPKKWNEAAMQRLAAWPQRSQSRTWPMLGMLTLGLVAGAAIGGYAVSQRSQLKRLAAYARGMGYGLGEVGEADVEPMAVTTPTISNHRRKATSEV